MPKYLAVVEINTTGNNELESVLEHITKEPNTGKVLTTKEGWPFDYSLNILKHTENNSDNPTKLDHFLRELYFQLS